LRIVYFKIHSFNIIKVFNLLLFPFFLKGLIGALTLSLLLVAKKMSRNNVLVKDLSVIETLSCVNVIASDKTGTLTQGKMTVYNVMTGKLTTQCYPNYEDETVGFMQLAAVAGLCNDATYLNSDGLRISKKSSRVSFNLKPQFIDSDPPKKQQFFSHFSTNLNKFSSITARVRKLSSYFKKNTVNKMTNVKGDPTDKALLKFSSEYVYKVDNLRSNYSIIHDIPFNRKNKWMMKAFQIKNLTTHNTAFGDNLTEETCLVFLKGAPDKLLNKCKTLLENNGETSDLTDSLRSNIIKIQDQWCTLGQRVLLICKKVLNSNETRELCLKNQAVLEKYIEEINDFCFLGMVGLVDPPRENMYEVIQTFRSSGIRVFMVTGDYSLTAAAIAKEIGIITNNEIIDSLEKMRALNESFNLNMDYKESIHNNSLLLSGADIENLTENDWRILTKYQEIVFARTTPEQKLRLVKEFQHDDYIVGVTGNGLNDAPALKKADIGIAMGDGNAIAMDASQMVLLDSHFSSILIGIENGRLVFDNLRKVVLYLLSAGCMGEV
jgi:sodium/potassium-transporting ATPase subunit alpha